MNQINKIALTLAIMLLASGAAWSASADMIVKSCKDAIADSQGSGYSKANLQKIKPRGSSYETWFNVTSGDQELKSYCYIKRGEVQQLITSEGRWSSNPKRPKDTQPSLASN
ncbi:MAG: hypothetical protein OER85_00580 [Gammaproteobacteria bacterium]|nr:hypothetical protein [Gammaproteobacteria bacterium]